MPTMAMGSGDMVSQVHRLHGEMTHNIVGLLKRIFMAYESCYKFDPLIKY